MKRLVRFPLEDGNSIIVEVDEPETGTRRVSRADDVLVDAQYSFEQALSAVRSATESAITKLCDLSHRPHEIEMEFGFNLSGEFGAVIAKITADANYKVTLRWRADNEGSNT